MDQSIRKRPTLVMAEFDRHFMQFYQAFLNAAPVEIFSSPKVYMHDQAVSVNPAWMPADEGSSLSIPVMIKNVGFIDNSTLLTTQLVVVLMPAGNKPANNFTPYAVLLNDPFRGKHARKFSRSLINSIMEYPRPLTVNAFIVSSALLNDTAVEAVAGSYVNPWPVTQM